MVIASRAARHLEAENKSIFKNTSSGKTGDSFAGQLSSALEKSVGKSGNGSQVETNSVPAQRSGAAQLNLASPLPPTKLGATAPATTPPDKSTMTPTDAYWAAQPTAVQALRYAPNDQKGVLAQQLAQQGYSIDVPIMVWGWDPLATMIQRQQEGYTWVPSALQPSVQQAPGVSMPQNNPYDPKNPPAGSIQVSTAFADGTNIAADPIAQMWIKGQSST